MGATHILISEHVIRTEWRSLLKSYIGGPYPMEGPKWSGEGVSCRFPSGRMFPIQILLPAISVVIES